MIQTLRYLSQPLSSTLKSVDIWKVFQTIPLTHPTNFALVNIALNLFPGGPDVPDPKVPLPVTQLHPDVHGHLEGVPDYHSYPSQQLCLSKHCSKSASWGPRWSRPSRWGWPRRGTSGPRCTYQVVTRRPRRSHRHPNHPPATSGSAGDVGPYCYLI